MLRVICVFGLECEEVGGDLVGFGRVVELGVVSNYLGEFVDRYRCVLVVVVFGILYLYLEFKKNGFCFIFSY